jgi:alpha-L-rhamnosidase
MTSFNHYAFGAVADWMHGVIGGLRPKEPGWKVAEVKPVPGGGITSAETRYVSMYGEFKVAWRVEGENFSMVVTVPPNARAEVTVPGGETTEVGSGVHEFTRTGYEMASSQA